MIYADTIFIFMQLRFQSGRLRTTLLLAVLLGPIAAVAGPSNSSTSPGGTSTNAIVAIPQSIFVPPSANNAAKDPFFPNSKRLVPVVTRQPDSVAAIAADLVLKGLSGRPDAPLATINNVTFGVGEEREVRVLSGRVQVRCVKINLNDESVVIEVGGQRRELRFPREK